MLSNAPELEITYFIEDDKKEGGRYETILEKIKKIDNYNQKFIMENGIVININDVIDIDSEIFKNIILE